jgi:hypothetical protein
MASTLAGALVACSPSFAQLGNGSSMSSGRMSMRNAGKAYAEGDVSAAMNFLDGIVRRGGRTAWECEALYLGALVKLEDEGNVEGALHDLRLLTARHPGTAAAVYGQFRIAATYEALGLTADAYREYVLCSRLTGLRTAQAAAELESDFPAARLTAAKAADLITLATPRALGLFSRAATGETGVTLPLRTYLLADPRIRSSFPTTWRHAPRRRTPRTCGTSSPRH